MNSDTDAPSSPQFRRSHRVGAHDLEGAGISMQYRIANSRGIEVRSMFHLWQSQIQWLLQRIYGARLLSRRPLVPHKSCE